MREIKFRAWDGLKKKMLYSGFAMKANPDKGSACTGLFLEQLTPNCDDVYGLFNCFENVTDYTVFPMQFTGIKDKNGKEIYEGDIVRLWSDGEDQGIQAITWSDEGCCFTVEWDGFGDYDSTSIGWALGSGFDLDAEVLGNVYENKELLNHPLKRA